MRRGTRLAVLFAVVVSLALSVGAASSAPPPDAVTFAIADDAAQRAFPSELASARGVGMGAARAYVSWADVATRRPTNPRNPADPAYAWAQTDGDMARYASAGLAVWVAFWRTPFWASGSTDTAVWPVRPGDLGDFAYAVARRYPQVRVFMDWNEPNLKAYAKPNTIAAYEPMARAVYAGVKAASPGAQVVAGNLGKYRDNGRDPALWAATLRADAVPMDAFGIHPYPDPAKPLAGRAPRSRIDLFDVPALARIVGVPVAVTEFGWSSQLAGAANQATWTAQAISVARCTPGLSQLVFWGYHDHPVPPGQTADPWTTYGWLDATGAPKPVYDAGRSALASAPDCSSIGKAAGAPSGWPSSNTIPPPINSAPTCTNVALSTVSGGTASADVACTDVDGDPVTYAVTSPPTSGTLVGSGSVFAYTAGAGFTGTATATVSASDGVGSTPITITVSVTAPVAPVPPASVNGAPTLANGVVTLGFRCTSGTAACVGSANLSTTLNAVPYSLGSRQVSLQPGTAGTFAFAITSAASTALRPYAGKTVSLDIAFVTTTADGVRHTTTTTVPLAVP
jgi:hypothetical protein